MEKITFIGTGVMGKSIVRHLLRANFDVTIFTRTKEKAEDLLLEGAVWAETVRDATIGAKYIFTMAGYPVDIEDIYFGENGIFKVGKEGQILVDMTTSSPKLAKRIAKTANSLGMAAIDAPVSGGDIGAQNGTLSIMCGGDKEVFEEVSTILSIFGKDIVYQGKAGAGQHTKMANQIAISTNMIGVCEALAYAREAELELEAVLSSITLGAAGSWSLSNLAPRMLVGDYEPGFYVKHFLKDMDIALAEAEMMQLNLPGLKLARQMYDELVAEGFGNKGTQVLYKKYS